MRTHLVVDFDMCLVDTSEAKDYLNTREGREYIANNPDVVNTRIMDFELERIVRDYSRNNSVTVISNAPENYVRAILNKHGFSNEMEVIGSAKKPSSKSLKKIMNRHFLSKNEIIVIGDSARDILAAHDVGAVSIGTLGGYSDRFQLKMAGATRIYSEEMNLEDMVLDHEKGLLEYIPREIPDHISEVRRFDLSKYVPPIQGFSLGEYTPWGRGGGISKHSESILRFKNSKEYTIEELNKGARRRYFVGGRLREESQTYKEVFFRFLAQAEECILSNIRGEAILVAAPNSFPEWAYKTDINKRFVNRLSERLGMEFHSFEDRIIYRLFPKEESHWNKKRVDNHFESMGVLELDLGEVFESDSDIENVIIFDDVSSTGNQVKSIASVLSHLMIGRNFYCLVLGDVR